MIIERNLTDQQKGIRSYQRQLTLDNRIVIRPCGRLADIDQAKMRAALEQLMP